jgi:sugar/nucleoside kinase (ribokinase family)
VFIEGYVFANPETGQGAIRDAIRVAKENGTKIAVTASDGFIPQVFGDVFREALVDTDLLFCNGPESLAITGAETTKEAFEKLKGMVSNFVVTDGPDGALISYAGSDCHVPAYQCKPKDLTGAGDMFAGAFLYGINNGYTAEVSAKGANFLCMKVITQVGARLQSGAKEFWHEATRS